MTGNCLIFVVSCWWLSQAMSSYSGMHYQFHFSYAWSPQPREKKRKFIGALALNKQQCDITLISFFTLVTNSKISKVLFVTIEVLSW